MNTQELTGLPYTITTTQIPNMGRCKKIEATGAAKLASVALQAANDLDGVD